jgi:L-asparaginase
VSSTYQILVPNHSLLIPHSRIGSAFYTTKMNANSLDTFYSTEAGQLGFYINQVPYFYYEPAKPIGATHFNLANTTTLAQVDILYAHQEMAPSLAQFAVAAGAQGLVFAGMGAGGLSGDASTAVGALFNSTGVPIVASHRSPDGFVPSGAGDYAVASGFYNPQKARVLLQLCVTLGLGLEEIKEGFALSYPAA